MKIRQPIVIVFLVVAILAAIGWTWYANRAKSTPATTTTTTTQVSNLTNADPTDFDSPIKTEYATANAKALEANAADKLAAIEIDIGPDLQTASVMSRYIFVASNNTKNNWLITFSESSGNFIRALVPKEDYLGDPPVMNTALWKYNYVTALQLAEAAGGQTWRASNTLTGLKLTLKHSGANNWLMWIVEYQSDGGGFTVDLDANSGKVITQ